MLFAPQEIYENPSRAIEYQQFLSELEINKSPNLEHLDDAIDAFDAYVEEVQKTPKGLISDEWVRGRSSYFEFHICSEDDLLKPAKYLQRKLIEAQNTIFDKYSAGWTRIISLKNIESLTDSYKDKDICVLEGCPSADFDERLRINRPYEYPTGHEIRIGLFNKNKGYEDIRRIQSVRYGIADGVATIYEVQLPSIDGITPIAAKNLVQDRKDIILNQKERISLIEDTYPSFLEDLGLNSMKNAETEKDFLPFFQKLLEHIIKSELEIDDYLSYIEEKYPKAFKYLIPPIYDLFNTQSKLYQVVTNSEIDPIDNMKKRIKKYQQRNGKISGLEEVLSPNRDWDASPSSVLSLCVFIKLCQIEGVNKFRFQINSPYVDLNRDHNISKRVLAQNIGLILELSRSISGLKFSKSHKGIVEFEIPNDITLESERPLLKELFES